MRQFAALSPKPGRGSRNGASARRGHSGQRREDLCEPTWIAPKHAGLNPNQTNSLTMGRRRIAGWYWLVLGLWTAAVLAALLTLGFYFSLILLVGFVVVRPLIGIRILALF